MSKSNTCVPGSKLLISGMVENPHNAYTKPYYWVDEFIPYYMEKMGVWTPAAGDSQQEHPKSLSPKLCPNYIPSAWDEIGQPRLKGNHKNHKDVYLPDYITKTGT